MFQLKTLSNRLLAVTVAGITLLLVLLSVISILYTNRMVSQYSTLVANSIEVKLEIATAHLWLEEVISGDLHESIETVWLFHDKASHHLDEILKCSRDPLINVGSVDFFQIRQDINHIKNKLAQFRNITLERFNSIEYAGAGSEIDQIYDAAFVDLLKQIDKVIKKLKSFSKDDLEQFNLIQLLLILLILITATVFGFVLYLYQKRLMALYNKQLVINRSLSETETRLQDIAFCGGDWIWEVDSSGRYTYASENVVDIMGYYPDEIIGRTPFDLMPAEESKRVAQLFAEIVKKQGKITDLDNLGIHKNGKYIYLRTNAVPVFDASGQLTGYRGVDKDITEQKAMNDLLMRTQKMDALGKLTGSMVHDFNNMLGAIKNSAELLQNKLSVDDKLNKYVQQIYSVAEGAKKLTAKLLAFTNNESDSTAETDINQLLRDDQHMLERSLGDRIRLAYELEVDLWNVCLDRSALQDAILNISNNAMHAITDTGVFTITTKNVSLTAEDGGQLNIKPGDYVKLSFVDTGVGMDETTQQKAFDPFFTTKGDSGTGLGLSQVYGFAQQSGGAIQVYSKPEQGTQMVIYLPRCLSSATDEPVVKTADTSWDYSGDETILVVDDEGELCGLAKDFLTKHGYKVLCAQSGEKALDILENETVDLLFSDVVMPGMGGYELASTVKKNYPDIIIQMASGFSNLRHERKFDEKLHQQRLLKPYGSKILLHRIRELLDRAHAA